MSQVCMAFLLATSLAAPVVEPAPAPAPTPVAAPATETVAEPAPAPAPTPVAAPATETVAEPAPAPVVTAAPAPTPAPAAAVAPTPVVTLAPAPAPTVAPAPVAAPPPPRLDPELVRARNHADGLVAAGAAVTGLGGATLLLVAWPTQALYRRSLERAESVRWVTEQDRFLDEARRRRSIMLVSAGIGAGLTVVGTAILATGLSRRARLRNPSAATLSLAPAVGGGTYGVGASMRF